MRQTRVVSTPRIRRLLATTALVAATLALSGCLFLPSPHPAPPPPAAPQSTPDVQDFAFESYDATYALDRDVDGGSTLTATETFVALFPEFDQNHGIRRSLVDPTGTLEVTGVTDDDGAARVYDVDPGDGYVNVTIAGDDFVHGRQVYVIAYRQSGVISDAGDKQVFLWDLTGTGWAQPFGDVDARIVLGAGLTAALTGEGACYYGPAGSTSTCNLRLDGDVVTIDGPSLKPHETVTVELLFAAGTFGGR